ncbi:MAG: ArdC family protein [Leptospirales bacterium]
MNTQEFYEQITEKMIHALESGTAPWIRPWKVTGDSAPVNALTGKPYRGVNALNLSWHALSMGVAGVPDMRYATFKQAKEKGWKIRGGSKGIPILKLVPVEKKEKVEREEESPGHSRDLLIPKVYFVFQAKDLEGIPTLEEKPKPADWSGKAEEIRSRLSTALNVPVNHGGGRAFYLHTDDRIQMPFEGSFEGEKAYLGTLLHEFGHATGHEKRLNRAFGVYGDPDYAFEELVAEMTSLFVAMSTGISPSEAHFQNHAAYVHSWIEALEKDKKALVRASKLAQAASDLLVLNMQ